MADNSKEKGYAGYFHREVPAEDPELTHTGPGTECGEYLRRYWQPVAMSNEVKDLPLAIRILGEDLVLFRDQSAQLGLLHRHCAHRGASLEFGIIMDCGIKCCYHGWHFDVDGRLIDAPSEPPGSQVRNKVIQGAYPVREEQGLIFAYLGPPDKCPDFPVYDTMCFDDTQKQTFSLSMPANWLQVYENTQDPIHVLHLHALSSGIQFGAASGVEQLIEYTETPLGMMNIQTRRVGAHLWARTTETILPNCNQTGAIWEEAESKKVFQRVSMLRWMVPIDNTHTMTIGWRYSNNTLDPRGQDDLSIVGKESIDFMGQTAGRSYEEQQRQPGDYEVQVSQRPIAVHALEHRVTSDRGVSKLRGILRKRIRDHSSTGAALMPTLNEEDRVSTYCQDTVYPVKQEADEDSLMRKFGRRVAETVVETGENGNHKRTGLIEDMCAAEFT